MPTIIRQALSGRIRALPAMAEFLHDFGVTTGLSVEFVGPFGDRGDRASEPPLCRYLRKTTGGCRHCSGTVQQLLERCQTEIGETRCDAGMYEYAVPLRAGGQVFGHLVIGGFFASPPALVERNGIRHRLERLGLPASPALMEELCDGTPVVPPERQKAAIRLLILAASHLALIITDSLAQTPQTLPPLIRTVCEQARRGFTREVSLSEIAGRLGVSTAHLCRTFHHVTGIRFREYVGRLRAEYAREQLESTQRKVTEIAFAAGFQSLSQFNRVFRSVYGESPRNVRRQAGSAAPRARSE